MERHVLFRVCDIDRKLRRREYPNCSTLKKFFHDHHRMNISIRTIMRDLDTMRDDLGAPLEFDREKNGYYYTDEKFALPQVRLTERELVAVFLAEELLRKYQNTPFGPAIEQAFQKIKLLLPGSVSIDFNEIGQTYSFDVRQTRPLDERSAKVFDSLAKAIGEKKGVEIVYYAIGRNATQKRVVDPYHLRYTQGSWYLVGYCHWRKEIRTFAVNQVREIKVLARQFTVQPGFSPEKFFEHSWGISQGEELVRVVVRIDREVARWFVDRKLHSSQQTKENKDGSLTLTFKVAGTGEIKRWILSQGSKARVLEPKQLRTEIIDEAKKMLQGYK